MILMDCLIYSTLMMTMTEFGIIWKLIRIVIGMMMPIQIHQVISSPDSIVKTMTMMEQTRTQMATDSIKQFGIKESRGKDCYSPNSMMSITTMTAFQMVKIGMMTMMEHLTNSKSCSVSGVKNNLHGITTMMVS